MKSLIIRGTKEYKGNNPFGYLQFVNYLVNGKVFINAPGFQMFITPHQVRQIIYWLGRIDELSSFDIFKTGKAYIDSHQIIIIEEER